VVAAAAAVLVVEAPAGAVAANARPPSDSVATAATAARDRPVIQLVRRIGLSVYVDVYVDWAVPFYPVRPCLSRCPRLVHI
jgi:hypothetical protein